jgi:hypothetical protein
MYLRIIIILNGVADIYRQHRHLNCQKPLVRNRLKAFTFQPELRSGYYTPMRERPFIEHTQGTARPLAFEIDFRFGNRGNYCQRLCLLRLGDRSVC